MRLFQATLCAAIMLVSCADHVPTAPTPNADRTDGSHEPASVPTVPNIPATVPASSAPTPTPAATVPAPGGSGGACSSFPQGAPILYGPDVTLDPCSMSVRVQPGNAMTTVHLPLAASVPGMRWTVKVWGDDANEVVFLPAVDPATGLMDGMNDIDGDALLETSGGNPAIILEAFGDTDGPDGPGAPGGPDVPGWMVISR